MCTDKESLVISSIGGGILRVYGLASYRRRPSSITLTRFSDGHPNIFCVSILSALRHLNS